MQAEIMMYISVAECFKEAGYSYDPATKMWGMVSSPDGMIRKNDLVRECVSRRTGIPPADVPIIQRKLDL